MHAGRRDHIAWQRTRRSRALVQLLLFVFAVITPLLPCAHAHAQAPVRATVAQDASPDHAPAAMHHVMSGAMSQMMHHAMPPEQTEDAPPSPASDAPPAHSAPCLWVTGCVGAVSVQPVLVVGADDGVESQGVPMGPVLQRVQAVRTPEVPPPRS